MIKIFPLLGSDILPYEMHETAVRIMKRNLWFVGMVNSFTVDERVGKLRVMPLIKFLPANPPDPLRPGEELLNRADKPDPGGPQEMSPPFTLEGVKKLMYDGMPEHVLIVQFDVGGAVLSRRNNDIAAVQLFLAGTK